MWFPDFSITLVYLLCILSTLACIIYGILNWNNGSEPEQAEISKEPRLEKKEQSV